MSNAKKKCAWCGKDIPGTEEYYAKMGNCCSECSAKFTFRVKVDNSNKRKYVIRGK